MLFNKIYNKHSLQPVHCEVKERWFRTWATWCRLNCSRRTPRLSAQHACHIGVKASSTVHAGISWKKQWPMDVSFFPWCISRTRNEEGTSWPQIRNFQKTNNINWPIIWNRCKKDNKGIHGCFLRDHVFHERVIQNNRDEEVCRAWGVPAEQDDNYRMSESEYCHNKQNWWISQQVRKWHRTGEKTSWCQPSVVYINTFTPRNRRTTTRADTPLEL